MYKALSDDERKKLREIADLGLQLSKSTGKHSFGGRHRAPASSTPHTGTRTRHLEVIDGGDSDDEVVERSMRLDEQLQQSEYCVVAKSIRKQALAARKTQREEEGQLQHALADGTRGGLPLAWSSTMVPSAASPLASPLVQVHKDEFSKVHTSVPCAVYTAQVKPARVDELVAGSVSVMAQKWRDRHIGVIHAAHEPMIAPAKRELCQEAQECVCHGDGTQS